MPPNRPLMQPRQYPIQFGRAVADIYDLLASTPSGMPNLPVKLPPARESFLQLPDGDDSGLRNSKLQEVFNYLRRGKHLVIPPEWAQLISKPY